ncbi:acyl-coenzyme A thioesterase THEM4 [Microdochium nivale]|nr:acyl-coenzyme A thioesterase THEM4 [Microdochium nivale]
MATARALVRPLARPAGLRPARPPQHVASGICRGLPGDCLTVCRRLASSSSTAVPSSSSSLPPSPSLFRRALSATTFAIVLTAFGFTMAAAPAVSTVNGLLNPPSDAETLTMYTPVSDEEREVEAFINAHPVVAELRARPGFTASRPHLKMPEALRSHTLTAGLLLGPGRVVVPPLVFSEEGGKSLVSISFLGTDLCGHPGIIHGGLLATMLDEGLARCCFPALPHKVGMTANLNINYRAPAPAGSYVALRATTTKVDGRKAWVEGRIETLVAEGETPVVLAEATALFISPKQAAMMAGVSPAS